MAKNRKNQFGPALTAASFCVLITASAVGYVWQKGKISQLGVQIRQRDAWLKQSRINNARLAEECAELQEPFRIGQRAKELNLGLEPRRLEQVVWIVEPVETAVGPKIERRQWAERNDSVTP